MKLVIGSDHHGFENKQKLVKIMNKYDWLDVGCMSPERCDFPEYAAEVARAVQSGSAAAGILMCASGIGMSIAANRFKNIYAALVWSEETARLAKEHNNANVLVLPGDFLSNQAMQVCIEVWMQAKFLGGRYQKRIDQIDQF